MTSLWEVIIQTLLAFFSILFMTRLLGKEQISQLTLYDYINGITFGSIAATLATDLNQRTWQHLVGLALFAFLTWLMSYISLKNRTFRKLVSGEPTILIHQGTILKENLKKIRLNMDELMSMLRSKNAFNLADVEYAILEPSGTLSLLLKPEKQPVTNETMNLSTSPAQIHTDVIIDGKILEENLSKSGKNSHWLNMQLQANGIEDYSEVIYAAVGPQQRIYIGRTEKQSNAADSQNTGPVH